MTPDVKHIADIVPQPKQGGQPLREAAFRRARSHSRKVRVLKLALPVTALLLAGSFAAYSYISVPGSVSFDISKSAYSDGKLVMANPKLEGFTRDSRPYSMSATRALQHIDKTGVVDLEGIIAKLPVGGENFAMINTDRGVYNREKNTLKIVTPISVKTTDGLLVTLQSAYLEIEKGVLKTKDPVDIKVGGVKLSADAMSVLENGKVLIFQKRVKMELTPDRLKGRAGPTEESADQNVQN